MGKGLAELEGYMGSGSGWGWRGIYEDTDISMNLMSEEKALFEVLPV